MAKFCGALTPRICSVPRIGVLVLSSHDATHADTSGLLGSALFALIEIVLAKFSATLLNLMLAVSGSLTTKSLRKFHLNAL